MLKKIKSLFSILNTEQKNSFFLLLFLMITSSFLEIASVVVLLDFVNFFIMSENPDYFSLITKFTEKLNINFDSENIVFRGVITIIFLLSSSFFALFTIFFSSRFSWKTGGEIESRLFDFYLRRDYLFHIDTSSSKLLNKIVELVKRVTLFVLTPSLVIISKFFFLAPLLIGLAIFKPTITLITCSMFSVIYFLVYATFKKKLKFLGNEETDITKNKYQTLQEGFGGIKETKLLDKFDYFRETFKGIYLSFVNIVVTRDLIARSPKYFIEGLTFTTTIILVIYLSQKIEYSLNEILFSLSFFIICAYKIIPALQQIYVHTVTIKNHIPAFNQIEPELIEAKKILDKEKLIKYEEQNKFDDFKKINIKNLTFNYLSNKIPTINDLSLEILKGDRIAITGLSGSGKTTFIHILIGLINQDSGEIFADGKNVTKANLKNWQKILGFVPQSVFLSDKSIRENIAFGVEERLINQKKINEVLDISMLKETVNNLPEKDRTKIGERGVKLSGGQQQRLAIARALYFNPELLIFDEATNALDSLTESEILNSFTKLNKKITIVMIAHKIDVIKKFDKIIFLNEGKIEGFGSFDSLIEKNQTFKNLVFSSKIK
jgi:ATP-binding cassette, subfamily B, bacterial PglK